MVDRGGPVYGRGVEQADRRGDVEEIGPSLAEALLKALDLGLDLRPLAASFSMMTSEPKYGRLTIEAAAEAAMRLLVMGLSAVAAMALTGGLARAASPFDGTWTISETCPPTQTDVRGYAWTYAGVVRNGVLSASYQAPNEGGGSIRLRGKIAPTGSAMLDANGTVGHAEYAVGHLGHGTPYRFHVQAQFSDTSGSGQRMEQRQCDFSFSRS